MTKVSSYVEGPRWLGIRQFIIDTAINCRVTITSIEQDKGWINETVYFTAEGSVENLKQFNRILVDAVDDYNA